MKKFKNTVVVGGIVSALLGGVLLPIDAIAATKTSVVKSNDFTQQRVELGKALVGLDLRLEIVEGDTLRLMADRVAKLHAVKGSSVDESLKKLRLEGVRINTDVEVIRSQVAFLKVNAMNARDTSDFDRVRLAIPSLDKQVSRVESSLTHFNGAVTGLERSVAVQNATQLKKFDQSARGAFESRSVRNINYTELLTKLRADYVKKKKTVVVREKLLKEAEEAFKASNRAMVAEGLSSMQGAYVKIYTGDFAGANKDLLAYAKTKRVPLLNKYTADQLSIYQKYTKR